MRAVVVKRYGPPSVLEIEERATAAPGKGEIAIAIDTAGVGSWDANIRSGEWADLGIAFPYYPGFDGSGIVVATGAGVRRFKVGDRVWASSFDNPHGGFYAEYVTVKADEASRLPARMSMREAGIGAATGLTALQGVVDHLRVRGGQTVLIFGASGAVGTVAVRFAKCRGAYVIAAATGAAARRAVTKLGADMVFDPRNPRELDRLEDEMGGDIDAILAFAGGDALHRCATMLRRGGRVVYPDGVEPVPKKGRGYTVKMYTAKPAKRHLDAVTEAAEECRLKIPVAATFPLSRVAEAHRRLEKGHVIGRIALRI
jgi:NADPH:quinone reductase-like Zn-dependent oxidoreductase